VFLLDKCEQLPYLTTSKIIELAVRICASPSSRTLCRHNTPRTGGA
jgi:hypothetical protein